MMDEELSRRIERVVLEHERQEAKKLRKKYEKLRRSEPVSGNRRNER
jgi:hypothetical protein